MSDPNAGFSDSLNTALNSAPELGKSPGLSVGIAQAGGNVQQNAQATVRGTNAISDTSAHQSVALAVGGQPVLQTALDWFGNHVVHEAGQIGSDIVSGAKAVASPVLNTLNKPMQIVQHEYRYLHDVEAVHGPAAALLEGLGIAAGTAAGTALTGSGYGGMLGAELTAGLEGQVFYKDSWDRTAKASYADPNTHQQVSIGRDVMSELSHAIPGLERQSVPFKVTSGLIDGIFDMSVGGTEVLGLVGKAKSAEGLGGALGSYFPGHAPQTTEAFDNLVNSFSGGATRRAFADMASKNAGEIANAYPSIAMQSDLLRSLGNATTPEQVTDIFRNVIRTHEMMYMDRLPSLAITRLPFQVAHEAMGDSSVLQRLFKNTSRLPTSWDEVAKQWTMKDFNPASTADDGTLGFYRTSLFTEKRPVAAAMASDYANESDPAKKLLKWRNLVMSTLMNQARYRGYSVEDYLNTAFDDPQVRQAWSDAIDKFVSTSMLGPGADYGLNDQWQNISTVRDTTTGTEFAAAITHNQTGRIAYLDLRDVRRAGKMLRGANDLFGRVDDFAFDRITAPVFKRWVLMSPSYALHIAMAEVIPNALRLGLVNLAKARLEQSLAYSGLKVTDEEAQAMGGLLWKIYSKTAGVLPARWTARSQQDVGYLMDWVEANDGLRVSPALTSGHNYGEEIMPRESKSVSLIRRSYFDSPEKPLGDTFGKFALGHTQHTNAWQARLWESAQDPATQAAATVIRDDLRAGMTLDEATSRANTEVATYLRNLPEEEKRNFIRSDPNITAYPRGQARPPDEDQFDEWARAVTARLRGVVRGADGTTHDVLLTHVVNGTIVPDARLEGIAESQRPLIVSGREELPGGNATMQNIANAGFRKLLNPIVNFLSREPIAGAEYIAQRRILQDSVDRGIIDADQAHVLAESSTVSNVIKNVHNLTDRTQWTVTLRNWAPFYFAQEQAYRRMGRLLAEDPAAFRKYQLMIQSVHNVGQVFAGKDGRGYLVFPGTGWMTAGMVDALAGPMSLLSMPVDTATPVGMGWNLSASSVIFPLSAGFRPDIGPVVSVAMSAISQLFPETLSPVLKADLTAAENTILGPTASEPIYEQMIPNTILQRLLMAAMPTFNSRSFNSTMLQTLATLDYEHLIPGPDANYRVKQAFMDRLVNQTRVLYIMKALIGGVTPVSPELTNVTFNQFSADVTAAIKKHGSVAAGMQAFMSEHPDATPFTVWQSSNLTGMSIPSSIQAEEWINQNYDLITRYPNAGILLMPMKGMSNKYSPSVYNQQIAQGLRSKLDPGQWTQDGNVPSYLDALYIGAGNAIFYKWYAQYEQQTKGLAGSAKYDASQAFWGNGTLGSGTVGKYGQKNPVWWQWFQSSTREVERGQAINQMRALLKDNPRLKTPIAENTRILLTGYANYENQIATLTKEGSSSTLATQATDAWKNYLYSVAQEDPEMTNVITGLFVSIPLASAVTSLPSTVPGEFTAQTWNKAS